MVMKLYGMGFVNDQRAILPLFEAKVDVEKELELVKVSVLDGQQLLPIFTKKQPFGKVPYFEDGDIIIFESRAIARYLAGKIRRSRPGTDLLSKTAKERAAVHQWSETEAHGFTAACGPLIRELFRTEALQRPGNEEIVKKSEPGFNRVLDILRSASELPRDQVPGRGSVLPGGDFPHAGCAVSGAASAGFLCNSALFVGVGEGHHLSSLVSRELSPNGLGKGFAAAVECRGIVALCAQGM